MDKTAHIHGGAATAETAEAAEAAEATEAAEKHRPGRKRVIALAAMAVVVGCASLAGGLNRRADHETPEPSGARHAPHDISLAPDATALATTATPIGSLPSDAQARPFGGKTERPPKVGKRDHEAENGEGSNPTSTKQLQYRGLAVQTSPRIYLVLWGPSWFSGGDPDGVASRLHYFYQGVGGSGWANVLKQYGSNYGSFGNPAGQYRGWIQDTTTVPSRPTQTDIANAAIRAANRMGDTSYNAQYIIATPNGVVDQYSLANKFCAWHNYTSVGTAGNWITYTSMPYMPYVDRNIWNCGGGWVNGQAGVLDGVTILASHEYAETVNDPSLGTWTDPDNSENADKCSWINIANRTLANGYTFPVQPSWSNQWRQQYNNGCLYSS